MSKQHLSDGAASVTPCCVSQNSVTSLSTSPTDGPSNTDPNTGLSDAPSHPPIRSSLFSGPDGSRLTKFYERDQDGNIRKTSHPQFSRGTSETVEIEQLSGLPKIINRLEKNQCLATGVFDQPDCPIVPKADLDEDARKAGVRSRTKDCMTQPAPGLILLDHDRSPNMPEELRCSRVGDLISKIVRAIPSFQGVGYVGAGSCSSGIYTDDQSLSGGLHVYVAFEGNDLEGLTETVEIKLWNAGLGYVEYAKNGALLLKTIIDLAVFSQERLIYEAPPVLGDGVHKTPRIWVKQAGKLLSADLQVSDDERKEYRRRIDEAKRDPGTLARSEQLRKAYEEKQVVALADHKGVNRTDVSQNQVGEDERLAPDHVLEIKGQTLTASELLERGEEFDNTAMPDPIEGRDYGQTTAKFYHNGGIDPCIHSFAHGENRVYHFDRRAAEGTRILPKPLDRESFTHVKKNRAGNPFLPATIENTEDMLNGYGITARFNVIKKQLDIVIPGVEGTPENYRNTAITHIISLANLNGIPSGQIPDYVAAIGDYHPINPVAEWISSKAWDGVDRLPSIYATLTTRKDFPESLKHAVIFCWLLSAVAAAMKPRFHGRGVLTLQGPQGIGKTSWIRSLITDSLLREDVLLLGHHLDVANKDSVVTAASHWIVELGELDSSFKKDIARIKGHITATHDKVRRPYGKADSEYPRRTVFCATVNEDTFLVDPTGNSRWWTLPVIEVDYTHDIDMQQVFAQVARKLEQRKQWWLTQEQERGRSSGTTRDCQECANAESVHGGPLHALREGLQASMGYR